MPGRPVRPVSEGCCRRFGVRGAVPALAETLAAAPPWEREEMTASELFFAGRRFLLASEMVDDAALKKSLEQAGEKVMEMGLQKAG
jgi:hypothetical protein